MTKFVPLDDRVAIKPIESEEVTSGGIIIPDTVSKEKPMDGQVTAVGKGLKDKPMTLKVGDRVLYGKWGGTEVKLDGETLIIMKESDVLGIIQ